MKKVLSAGKEASQKVSVGAGLKELQGTGGEKSLSVEQFARIRDLIYQKSGMYFSEQKRALLESRLSSRLVALKLQGFDEYYYYLGYGSGGKTELQILFDQITTNETRFFRSPDQLRIFIRRVIPELLNRVPATSSESDEGKRLRIWSAGCATGEEPYSLALLIKENSMTFPEMPAPQILASDISETVLENARSGLYPLDSLSGASEAIQQRYFSRKNGVYKLSDDILSAVEFRAANLMDRENVRSLGQFDVIFCCNVLIYFDLRSKKKVLASLFEALKPGGYLFLSPYESLHGVTSSFRLIHLTRAMVYQKEIQLC